MFNLFSNVVKILATVAAIQNDLKTIRTALADLQQRVAALQAVVRDGNAK